MHENLLGYLLGALEPDEMRRMEQALRSDPELRRQLAEVERAIEPLAGSAEPAELPASDLVSRTMASLPPRHGVSNDTETRRTADAEQASGASSTLASPVRLSPTRERIQSGGARWQDWMVGSISAAMVLAILLPAVWQGRFEARKVACQDQLRRFGTAISQFVTRNHHQRLPEVQESGPEAFAGVYAIRLRDAGLLEDPMARWCPSLDLPGTDASEPFRVPRADLVASLEQLHRASVNELKTLQRFAGGHYAYTLGVREGESYQSPRYEQRASFAVMSDAPVVGGSVQVPTEVISHAGLGINVLFEDGHVRFISAQQLSSLPDHPWLNHRGKVEAGVTPDDAALAPSWRPPFVHSLQR